MATLVKFNNALPILALLFLSLMSISYISSAASGGSMGGSKSSGGSRSSGGSSSSRGGFSSTSTWGYHHGSGGGSINKDMTRTIFYVVLVIIWIAVIFSLLKHCISKSVGATILMIQVALSDDARHSLQRQINAIAKTSETCKGWHDKVLKTRFTLLCHRNFFISGYSYVEECWGTKIAEKRFKEIADAERDKFDIESLVNVNNVRRQREVIPQASKIGKDYFVVTFLLAAKGAYKVPAIENTEDIKRALLSMDVPSYGLLLGVKVLWTPQAENDALSEQEFLKNYPLLRPVSMT